MCARQVTTRQIIVLTTFAGVLLCLAVNATWLRTMLLTSILYLCLITIWALPISWLRDARLGLHWPSWLFFLGCAAGLVVANLTTYPVAVHEPSLFETESAAGYPLEMCRIQVLHYENWTWLWSVEGSFGFPVPIRWKPGAVLANLTLVALMSIGVALFSEGMIRFRRSRLLNDWRITALLLLLFALGVIACLLPFVAAAREA